jgi:tRNA(fMet)-specific endonuclease VapC
MTGVVDTDVLSFIYKKDSRGDLYSKHVRGRIIAISFATLAELEHWTIIRNWGERRQSDLQRYLKRFPVQHSTPKLCRLWAEVCEMARNKGRIIQPHDAWIAATALFFDVPLITHNSKDYIGIDSLTVITEI